MDLKTQLKTIRQNQTNQLSKLQLKAEGELELLEVLREYMGKRAELEHNYSKGLEKLSKGLLNKKFRKFLGTSPTPLIGENLRETYQTVSQLLSESEKVAKHRAEVSEKMTVQLSDAIKDFSKEKITSSKKNLEYGNKYHQELLLAYEEYEKAKSFYDEAAKKSLSAEKKYDDLVKKPQSGLQAFKNLVTGKDQEERIQDAKNKCKSRTHKLNDARNNLLLSLGSVNAIQCLYYDKDMAGLMTKMDGDYYKNLSNYFTVFENLETFISDSVLESVENIKKFHIQIAREKEVDLFLRDHETIFNDPTPFNFENSSGDELRNIVVDIATTPNLGRRLGKLLVENDALAANQLIYENEIGGLEQIADVYTQSPAFGNANSANEKKQDIYNSLDLVKAQRAKIMVQIEMLEAAGVQPIMPVIPEVVGKQMVAVSSYKALKNDELSISKDDVVEIVEVSHNNFTKVKTETGAIGLVPSKLLEAYVDTATNPKRVIALYDYTANDPSELSYKAGDEIECIEGIDADEEWWTGQLASGAKGTFNVLFTKGWESVAAGVAGGRRLSRMPSQLSRMSNPPVVQEPAVVKAKVLYSYEATCEGELSIDAGETITIISKETGSDAWWLGEGAKGKGQFPVNYVQIIDPNSKLASSNEVIQVRALYDFDGSNPSELSFKAGDVLSCSQYKDADWWDGEINGVYGAFPASYVERI